MRYFEHLKEGIIYAIRNFLHIPRDMLCSSDTEELADEILELVEPISVNDRLPVDRTWVLAHYNGDNWGPCGAINPGGQNWKVVQFIRGLSIADRAALDDTDSLKQVRKRGDEYGNNHCPYYWDEFGPGSFFGQDVDYWKDLPTIPTESDDGYAAGSQ